MEHGWRFYIWRDRVNLAVYVINNIPYVWVRMSEAGEREGMGGSDREVEEKVWNEEEEEL